MIEFNNDEDRNLWSSLEDFKFEDFSNISNLRIELYLALIKSMGYCGKCKYYNKQSNFCSLLETKLSPYERCSNFESVPNEDESAFDIMSEDFRREQQNLNNFARIRKYSRRPNIIRKENKKSKDKK